MAEKFFMDIGFAVFCLGIICLLLWGAAKLEDAYIWFKRQVLNNWD